MFKQLWTENCCEEEINLFFKKLYVNPLFTKKSLPFVNLVFNI